MNNSTANFTTTVASINSTTPSFETDPTIEICLYSISFLFGVPAHSYIIWLIITGPRSGIASEFINLNLSVSETGNSINNLIVVLTKWFSSLLTLRYFLTGLTIAGRPLFHCLMCVERYLAVVHPVTFLKYKPLRYRVICCSVVWIITLCSCLFCMFTITSNIVLYLWIFSVQYLLFLSIQLFCLVAVLRALKQSGPGERKREREEENHMKRKAFHLILISTVNMVIIYVPLIMTGLYSVMIEMVFPKYWLPAVVSYLLAGFVHPVLYLCRTVKFPCQIMLKKTST